jgi:ABC-type multidrug transport system ATPase subunit
MSVSAAAPDMAYALSVQIAERSVYKSFRKQLLLANVNLTINRGEMVMVMGGSGAGKTTLMNAVMGYERAVGKIMFGDRDIYKDYNVMKYQIGYVPQQDLLRGSDTVYDTLSNAARMKLPSRTKMSERRKQVLYVLKLMGLQRESMSLVSKLSGGQRKRLSIAVEYIAEPFLFFLDEPDSGLDGVMARELVAQLRSIADTGRIVMVITHSPDRVPDLFDKVIVLAKSTRDNVGRLAYFGSVDGVYPFFDTDTLEGAVRRVNRKDEGGEGLSDQYIAKYEKMEKSNE